MKASQLNILYTFVENNPTHGSFYKIVKVFTNEGRVDQKAIDKEYSAFNQQFTQIGLGFNDINELGDFTAQLADSLSSDEAYILSNIDYNLGLETCFDSSSYKNIFSKFGTQVEREGKSKGSSLFKKLF